jgi:hypothetical protein
MKLRRRTVLIALLATIPLVLGAVLFLRWANEAPPLEPLFAQLPRICVAAPENDSPELFLQLTRLHPAEVQPDVDTLHKALSQIADEAERREYLNAHREDILAARHAYDERLKILYRIASYNEAYDPPVPDFFKWNTSNLPVPQLGLRASDAKALVLLSELELMAGDREPLHRLIGVFEMLGKWRKNQWQTLGIISGIAAGNVLRDHLSALLSRGELTKEQARSLAATLKDSTKCQELFRKMLLTEVWSQAGMLLCMSEHPDSPFGRLLTFRERMEMRLGILNLPLTLHDFLAHTTAMFGALDFGKPSEAQRIYDDWQAEIGKRTVLRNAAGNRLLLVILPSFKFDWSELDAREAAFLERLRTYEPPVRQAVPSAED